MPAGYVRVPFAGYVTVMLDDVGGEDDEAATIDRAVEIACEAMTIETASGSGVDVDEWEAMHRIVQGNVCYAPLFEAEVEREEDDEDDEDDN